MKAADIMAQPVITVAPQTKIAEAARLMLQHKIAGLPVMRGDHLVGIITESDIFRLVVRTWAEEPVPAA